MAKKTTWELPKKQFDQPPFLVKVGSPDNVRTPFGHFLTESLFLELWRPATERPIYSLGRDDIPDPRAPGRVVYSFQREYIALQDPTGYKAAIYLLGSWEHWARLSKNKKISEYVNLWNEEIMAGLKSQGYDTYIKASRSGDLRAADKLISGLEPTAPVGRPRKERRPVEVASDADLRADLQRIKGT